MLQPSNVLQGTERPSKEQVQHMVRVLLGMDRKPAQDAADALACAICHLHHAEGRLRQTVAGVSALAKDAGGLPR